MQECQFNIVLLKNTANVGSILNNHNWNSFCFRAITKKMKISLDQFEQQIDETILKRGFDYFKKGHVTEVEELVDGDYEITVEGSDTYTVSLNIKGNAIEEFECDCPYDRGPVCKHVVAALFYLQENIFGTIELPAKKTRNNQKEKSIAGQAQELLNTLSHADLKAFIHDACVNDRQFRQLFVTKHIHLLYPESKTLYTKQLQALIKAYSDKYGFVDYRNAIHLGIRISEIAGEAMAEQKKGQIHKPMFIASAIIEELVNLINYGVDDSNGQIGGNIEEAFAILDAITELELNEAQHNELFDYLLSHFEKETFKGWDWHFYTIALAIKLLKTDQEKERIKSALDKIKPNGQTWDWDYEKAQELMLELIKKTESPEASTRYMENNISNSAFRAELIEKSLDTKDYMKAEKLALEGITQDEEDAPGLAEDWRNYLLTIYQQTGDIKNTIRLARHFLIHSSDRHHPLKYYYDLLKSLIDKDQWHNYQENLIAGIKKENGWNAYYYISQLYIWEAHWDKLLELLKHNASLERIADMEQYLADSYSDELASLYKEVILDYLKQNIGRKHYQTACQYIRRMIKLKSRPLATELIRELKALYPTRRALLEELNNV